MGEGLRFVVIPVMGSEYGHEEDKDDGSDNGDGGDEDGDYMIPSSLSHIFNKSVCYHRLWGWKLGLIFLLLHHAC